MGGNKDSKKNKKEKDKPKSKSKSIGNSIPAPIRLLKSIVEHLTNKKAAEIVDLLVGKKDVNEFLIAKKLDLTINQTRNILYKLSDFGLVSFIRKKDERKGWYIYFWTLNSAKSLHLLEKKLKEELQQLKAQLKSRNEKRYYVCNTCNIEVAEEAALLNNFVCQECEEVYELSDNEEIIKKLEKEISRLEKEIRIISEEREKEEEKIEKKKEKLKKIKDRKAKAKKKAARAKNKKARNKNAKKTAKKKPVKKTIKKVRKKTVKKKPRKKPVKKTVKKVETKKKRK